MREADKIFVKLSVSKMRKNATDTSTERRITKTPQKPQFPASLANCKVGRVSIPAQPCNLQGWAGFPPNRRRPHNVEMLCTALPKCGSNLVKSSAVFRFVGLCVLSRFALCATDTCIPVHEVAKRAASASSKYYKDYNCGIVLMHDIRFDSKLSAGYA